MWFHNLRPPTPVGLVETGAGASAVWVILRPGAVRPLLAMAAFQVTDTLLSLPHLPNHRLLSSLVNLLILGAAAQAVLRREPLRGGTLLPRFAPAARLTLVLFYGFAVFAKLNRDFLDPAVSCAAGIYRDIAGATGLLPAEGWAAASAIPLTLAVEVAVPVLLVRRPRVGVALGMPSTCC